MHVYLSKYIKWYFYTGCLLGFSEIMFYALHVSCSIQKLKLDSVFSKSENAVSRTSEPILGLFVLIWMYFLCWIQIWQWKFEFWEFLQKIDIFDLLFELQICLERDNPYYLYIHTCGHENRSSEKGLRRNRKVMWMAGKAQKKGM